MRLFLCCAENTTLIRIFNCKLESSFMYSSSIFIVMGESNFHACEEVQQDGGFPRLGEVGGAKRQTSRRMKA